MPACLGGVYNSTIVYGLPPGILLELFFIVHGIIFTSIGCDSPFMFHIHFLPRFFNLIIIAPFVYTFTLSYILNCTFSRNYEPKERQIFCMTQCKLHTDVLSENLWCFDFYGVKG